VLSRCEYASLLLEHFRTGRLPGCSGGESLRTTLAECLQCTPMCVASSKGRITKKLSSTHALGKSCFKKKGELTAQERVELESAREAFAASIAELSIDCSSQDAALEAHKRAHGAGHEWLGDRAAAWQGLENAEHSL
jgi:hypothetical protein